MGCPTEWSGEAVGTSEREVTLLQLLAAPAPSPPSPLPPPSGAELIPEGHRASRDSRGSSRPPVSPLHRGVMKLLKKETFCVQFNNHPRVSRPYRRRKTYLCYQLQLEGFSLYTSDYLQNKKGRHAEVRFVEKIRSMELPKDQNCQITCYLTWSPCPSCAQELADLKRSHPCLSLTLFTSRLYYHWMREFQEGLQHLWKSQVPVIVMGLQEFTDCWDRFVDHEGTPFEQERWGQLEERSRNIRNRLFRILRSWGVEDLIDNFRNLRL